MDGYRNYLGVKVIGVARWLPKYGFGVVIEITYDEAYAPLQSIAGIFGGVSGLLVLAAGFSALCSLKHTWLREHVSEARQLGQYTLGELIGQGGMGRVYKATHAILQRPAAIKLIESSEADEQTLRRFEREVQLASELTHPNTVQIFDYDRSEDGTFYYVMEYLSGSNLAELVARAGSVPAARVVHILRQVCASLAEAHGKGLVHRDIKPANIMLCQQGGHDDVVKVLDFGLVKRAALDDTQITRTDRFPIGTPLYMAPECIRQPSVLDSRSDVYAVGNVAFYLLTGEHVFDGETPLAVLEQVLHAKPRRPSDVVTQDIPAQLDDLVFACLAKEPEDRPANVSFMIEILDTLKAELPWRQTDTKPA